MLPWLSNAPNENKMMNLKKLLSMRKNDTGCASATTNPTLWGTARKLVASAMLSCALATTGNAVAQTITVDGNPSDWPAVLASSSITYKAFYKDPINRHDDDVWTRGSQNTDPISGWHWTHSNTNDKTDMNNTGVAFIGHRFYFFADLYAKNGDAAIGFWLLKGGVAPTPAGNFTGTHQEGDLLVSVLFTHGHNTSTPKLYKWHSGALTAIASDPNIGNAATNASAVASPWPYTPKSGPANRYPTNSFFEGYVNLDSVGGAFDGCFMNFITETWESQSAHAALADLIVGRLARPIQVTVANDTVCAGSDATFVASVSGGTGPYSYVWNGGSAASATYTIAGATASQSVTVTVSDAGGCGTASGIAQLVVGSGATINPVSDATYCSGSAGSAITFSSSVPGITFNWSTTADVGFGTSGTGNIPAYTATTGSVSVTTTVTVTSSSSGCPGTPVTFTIQVNPSPVVTVLDTSLCNGTTVALTGSPAGGTWAGYGVSGSTFDATTLSPGTYTVNYYMFGTGGCAGSANATVVVRKCHCGCARDGESTANANEQPELYPNPTTGAFTISVPALTEDSRITVFDLGGNPVQQSMLAKNDNSQQVPFDLSHIARGLYFIHVQSGDKRYMYKVVLK